MSFMNAKQARPVEDASALVPFGWAPGGYYCTACSTCGEAHSGSDKRSMRCQDCAEALRDKRADEPATPRETADHYSEVRNMVADHAELARRFHDTYERLAPSFGYETRADTKAFDPESPNGRLMTAVCNEVEAALLSEIAALRGERDGLRNRVSCLERLGGEQSTRVMQQATRAKDAERQRDELREALIQADLTIRSMPGTDQSDVEFIRQALANQGADQ